MSYFADGKHKYIDVYWKFTLGPLRVWCVRFSEEIDDFCILLRWG